MPMGGAGCGLAQSITGLLEQRQVNIEPSSFDLIEPSRDPAFPRTISVSFAVGLPSVQRTQEQQQAESLHEVSEAWGRWSPQAPARHTAVNTCPWMCFPRFSQPEECSMDTKQIVSGWTPLGSTATVQRCLFSGAEPSSTTLISLTHANATLQTLCFNSKQTELLELCLGVHLHRGIRGCLGALPIPASNPGIQFGGCSLMSGSQKGSRAAPGPGEKTRKGLGENCKFSVWQRNFFPEADFLYRGCFQAG